MQQGTVIFELRVEYPSLAKLCVRVLHAGMLELGLPCIICPKGAVDALDDYDEHTSLWHESPGVFRRPFGRSPDGLHLLRRAGGVYQVGDPLPVPEHSHSWRAPVRWRSSDEEERWRTAQARHHVTSSASPRAARPVDFNRSKHVLQWKQKWRGKGCTPGNWKTRIHHPKKSKMKHRPRRK